MAWTLVKSQNEILKKISKGYQSVSENLNNVYQGVKQKMKY